MTHATNRILAIIALLVVLVFPSPGQAQRESASAPNRVAPEKQPPVVTIERPGGGWSTERKALVTGTVSDGSLKNVTMSINGTDFLSKIQNSRFAQKVVVSRGRNTVIVQASNSAGTGGDSVSFYSQVPKVDMQIFLTFPPQPFYIDLWVTEPDGQKTYWSNRESGNGGVLHDLYNDLPGGAVGMGPQSYTISTAPTGEYLIQVNYWAGGGFNGDISEVGYDPYGKTRLPVIPIKVDVVLYEGTNREQRQTFRGMLFKPSDTYTVGKVMLRQAHESEEATGEIEFR